METKQILRKIKNDGYCVIGNIFSNKECLNYKESLIKIQNKLKKINTLRVRQMIKVK